MVHTRPADIPLPPSPSSLESLESLQPPQPPQPPQPQPQPQPQPHFSFPLFREQLQHRSAEPVVGYFRSFLRGFSKRPLSVRDSSRAVNDFLDFIAPRMRACAVWSSLDDPAMDAAHDAMEKLVMTRLYHATFLPAMDPPAASIAACDDLERDHVLTQRIRLLSWIQPSHLDLDISLADPSSSSYPPLSFACDQLVRMNAYKAPRDKLICFLNACAALFDAIGRNQGADAFVPGLIFIILQANPDHLVSNIQYIHRFRNPDRLQGEPAYYLSSLNGAITFIDSLDYTTLSNITREEFERNVEHAIKKLPPDGQALASSSTPLTSNQENSNNTNIDDLTVDRDAVTSPSSSSSSPSSPSFPSSHPATSPPSLSPTSNTEHGPGLIDKNGAISSWFQRSSQIAQRTVSKPLNAISKILAEMDEPDQDNNNDPDGQLQHRNHYLTPQRQGQEHMTSARRFAPGDYLPDNVDAVRAVQHNTYNTNQYHHRNIHNNSNNQTSSSERAKEREQRRAHVATLQSMFPELDHEVVQVVLMSAAGNLENAIDMLLDISQ